MWECTWAGEGREDTQKHLPHLFTDCRFPHPAVSFLELCGERLKRADGDG